ncbi:VWA domain-containing protein [Streptomyces sp. NPDC056660]|uniref:VWA domain-containing protein n=1 Tax=Streptomyces sp. NPDC056660 TaxID=3345897 RepID=UPI0036753540
MVGRSRVHEPCCGKEQVVTQKPWLSRSASACTASSTLSSPRRRAVPVCGPYACSARSATSSGSSGSRAAAESGAADPAFIVTQVGDEPWDKAGARSLLQNTASLGVFWLFVGFGRGKLAFYKNLNASASVTFTNVAFYDTSRNPESVRDERFYADVVDAFATWLRH